MTKFATLALAAFALTAAMPAAAQSYYSAKPAAAPAKPTLVTRSTLWKCAEGLCSAPRSGERDAVLCELVVQRVGAVESFTAGGAAFTPEALTKCNARAK
ncbi:CC_3452 family protein [Sphingomonas sp. RS2018]